MKVEEFLDLFILELEHNINLRNYYRLINNNSSFHFRKAYLHQRLTYVDRFITRSSATIWDIGCGYANTAIYLALNGHRVKGTTLEYYYDQIQERLKYWSRFGNLDKLKIEYQDLFDTEFTPASYHYIITQDTLHHLEPLDKALALIESALAEHGRLIVSDENGRNLFISIKNFLKRGNKRVIEYYDEKLNKSLLLGNENVQPYECWRKRLKKSGLAIDDHHTEYIRFYPPFLINSGNYLTQIRREQELWKRFSLLKNYFFFGINFTAVKMIR
jgi:SAM-dependent methyltransferase